MQVFAHAKGSHSTEQANNHSVECGSFYCWMYRFRESH